MASAGARGYMGSGAVPQCGPGAKPLVWGQGAKPTEADEILTFETPTLALFLTCFLSFLAFNCDI
jgi:hypothetical protein